MDDARFRQGTYVAYMLRLWQAGTAAGLPVWRASLENPHTGERLAFGDPQALFAFLTDLVTAVDDSREKPDKRDRPIPDAITLPAGEEEQHDKGTGSLAN